MYSGGQTHIVFYFCFLRPVLPVSMDCPFLIVPSVFSNVYLQGQAIEVYDIGIESIIISDLLQINK